VFHEEYQVNDFLEKLPEEDYVDVRTTSDKKYQGKDWVTFTVIFKKHSKKLPISDVYISTKNIPL